MKFYDENRMRECREALEATVLTWPGVAPKDMMGCKVYVRGSKFLAFLITDRIVLGGKLSESDRATVAKRPGAKPFKMGSRASSHGVQLPLRRPEDLKTLLRYVRETYDASAPSAAHQRGLGDRPPLAVRKPHISLGDPPVTAR